MSVLPPGATNSKVPPCATASSPVEHPASATIAAQLAVTTNRLTARPAPHNPSRRSRRRRSRTTSATPGCTCVGREVVQRLLGHRASQRLDRQLVADAHRFVAGGVDRGRDAGPPSSARRSRCTAHPTTVCAGCADATSCGGRAARRHPAKPVSPWKTLVDSMSSSSVSTARPCARRSAPRSPVRVPAARRPRRRCRGRPASRRPPAPAPGPARTGGSRAAGRRGSCSGLCTSPWRITCTIVLSLMPVARLRGGARRTGQRGGDAVERVVVESGRDEPGSRTRWAAGRRPRRAARGRTREPPRLGGLRRGEVGHRRVGEEHAEHVAGTWNPDVRHRLRSSARDSRPVSRSALASSVA